MVAAGDPGRVKLRARSGDDEQRSPCFRFCEGREEVERGRVAPLQIFDSENQRLHPRSRQYPGLDRGQLMSAQFIGRGRLDAGIRQGNVEQRRDYRSDSLETDRRQRLFQFSQTLRRRLGGVEALPPPLGDRMQRSILQQLRRVPIDPGVRRDGQTDPKFFQEPRLADAGLADDQNELAFARPGALPTAHQQRQLLLAAGKRGQRPRAGLPPAGGDADDAIEIDGLRHILEFAGASILDDKEPGDLALDVGGDEHGTGLGRRLNARGDAGRATEDAAHRIDHHFPGIETDSDGELRLAAFDGLGVQGSYRLLNGEGGSHRPLRVVLPRPRVAELRHQTVAEPRQDSAVKLPNRGRGRVQIGAENIAPVFHVELGRQLRCFEIARQKRDRATLDRSGGDMSAGQRRRARRRLEIGDRLHQALARPKRNAKFLETGFREFGQYVPVDSARAEHGLVLAHANTVEPLPDRHAACLCLLLSARPRQVSSGS